MKSKAVTGLVVAVLLAIIVIAPLTADDGDASPFPNESDTITFRGLIYQDGDPAKDSINAIIYIVPIKTDIVGGTRVYYYDTDPTKYSCNIKNVTESGKSYNFEITIPKLATGYSYYMTIQEGYKIYTVSDKLDPNKCQLEADPNAKLVYTPKWNGYKIIETSTISPVYLTTTTSSSVNFITLTYSTVTAEGYVRYVDINGNSGPLNNAEITFTNRDGDKTLKYTTTSERDGYFILNNVATGSYNVEISMNGYVTIHTIAILQEGQTYTANYSMSIDAGKNYFGFDLPHFLMILGGILCAGLIVYSLYMQHQVIHRKHEDWLINDMDDDDDEKE